MSTLKKSINLLLILLIIFSFFVFNACKNKQENKPMKIRALVTMLIGKAYIYQDGKQISVKKGMEVTNAKYIKTDERSVARITFSTGSSLTVEADSKITLNIKGKSVKGLLTNGRVLASVNKLKNNEQFVVNTPTAVAGVRGTKFFVSYNKRTRNTKVAVSKGKVKVAPVVTVQTSENVREHIQNRIGIEVTENQRVDLTQRQVEDVNRVIQSDITRIEQEVREEENRTQAQNQEQNQQAETQSQEQSQVQTTQRIQRENVIKKKILKRLSSVNSIIKAEKIIKTQKKKTTIEDKKVLQRIPDVQQPEENTRDEGPQGVSVSIYVKDAKIIVNGMTTYNFYSNHHQPGTTLNIQIEKAGFRQYSKSFKVPNSDTYSPQIILAKKYAVGRVENLRVQQAPLIRVAARFTVGIQSITPLYTYKGIVAFVGKDKKLYVVDMNKKGRLLKKINLYSNVSSTPVIRNNLLYFGTDNRKLYCIDLKSIRIKFVKRINGSLKKKNAATVNGHYIYFATQGSVYKLNRYNGGIIWKKSVSEYFDMAGDFKINVWSSVAVDTDNVYVGDEAGFVRAFNKRNGKLIWKQKSGSIEKGKILLTNNKVIAVTSDGWLRVFNKEDGKPIFTFSRIGTLTAQPIRQGKLVYFFTERDAVLVYNIEETKKVKWIKTDKIPRFILNSASYIINDRYNKLKQISIFGSLQWTTTLDAPLSGNPAADSLYVYALTKSGFLYKINRFYRLGQER